MLPSRRNQQWKPGIGKNWNKSTKIKNLLKSVGRVRTRVVHHFARNPKTLKDRLGSLFILESVWLLWLKRGFPTRGGYVTIAHGGTEDYRMAKSFTRGACYNSSRWDRGFSWLYMIGLDSSELSCYWRFDCCWCHQTCWQRHQRICYGHERCIVNCSDGDACYVRFQRSAKRKILEPEMECQKTVH